MNQDNNFNQYNFNSQGNNGMSNNQPLNSQAINQNMNVNQHPMPSFQQPIMQEPIPQSTNTFDGGNFNNQSVNGKPPKKMNLGLIIGIVAVVAVVGVGLVFGSKLLPSNNINNSNIGSSNNEKVDVVYYDNSRKLKDSYTFKEAVSKFAFKVSETTLIFQENDRIKLEMMQSENTLHDELMNTQFNYKQDIYTSLGAIYLGESNSTTLEEFKTNFNNGILSDKTKWIVENVQIIEETADYVFASWTNKAFITTNEYYFAKQIGSKIFYVYHSSSVTYNDTKISLLLDEFKNLFTCLSEDDGKEAYLYDKIVNVPIVLNKQIKNSNDITAIINIVTQDSLDGSVSFSTEGSDYVSIEYNASGHYDRIDWTKTLDSNIKLSQEDNEYMLGIKDENNTQVFKITIYSDKQINNKKDFDSYISVFLTNK